MRRPVMRPCYLVVDVSRSMSGGRRDEAAGVVGELLNVLQDRDSVDGPILLCAVEFAGQARTLSSLDRLATLSYLPDLSAEGDTTSFAQIFDFLRQTIGTDVRALSAERMDIGRPVVFLLTDGEATDAWEPSFVRLTEYDPANGDGFPWYPFVVPVGIGAPDLTELAGFAFPLGVSPVVIEPSTAEFVDSVARVLDAASGVRLPPWPAPDAGVDDFT